MKQQRYIILLLCLISLIYSQLPDIKNYYNGFFYFKCKRSIIKDSDETIVLGTSYRFLEENSLPDTIFVKDAGLPDTSIYTFSYFPSELKYQMKYHPKIDTDIVRYTQNVYYNENGKILFDSCFDEENNLCYYSAFDYTPTGKIKQISTTNTGLSIITSADTVYWKYKNTGEIDSVKIVYYNNLELCIIDLFLPEYDDSGNIEKAIKYTWDFEENLFLTYYFTYFNGQVPVKHFNNPKYYNTATFTNTMSNIKCTGNLTRTGNIFYEIFDFTGKRHYKSKLLYIETGYTSLKIPLKDANINSSGRYILRLNNQDSPLNYIFNFVK